VREPSRIASSSSYRVISRPELNGGLIERWLEEVLAAPGATALATIDDAWAVLLEDALRAAPLVRALPGRVVDVGSGGGSPGLPLAVALPDRTFTLLEAQRRKCEFLERFAGELANVGVVWGRAEDQPLESFGVALAKALARPPVAVELCLPLVEVGGAVLVWLGRTAERDALAAAASLVGGLLDREEDGIAIVRKIAPTPPGFPRRPGIARKRPLA
jgi:16S rRNA (guanine527-N7)-methyltransferase